MKKLLLMSGALGVAGLLAFFVGRADWRPLDVEAQGAARLYPKVSPYLSIDGLAGEFPASVGSLEVECEIIEDPDPETGQARKRPGRVKYGDITLKKGYLSAEDPLGDVLHKWFESSRGGGVEKKTGLITLKGETGDTHAQYQFFEAWPCKWKGARAPDASSAFTEEAYELVIQKIQRVK